MKLYSCHNQPRSEGYYAQDGVVVRGVPPNQIIERLAVYVPDTMSRECRYDKQQGDARCAGCVRANKNEGRAAA